MVKNLTNSYRDRQKILNNPYVLQKIEQHFNFDELFWDRIIYKDNSVFTKQQLSCLFDDVSLDIIDICIASNEKELKDNGYELLKDEVLEKFLLSSSPRRIKFNTRPVDPSNYCGVEMLELFTFKAWLNIIMLLSESKKAEFVRSRILDIVIDTVAEKESGRVKYIDRRIYYCFPDVYLQPVICPKHFTDAIKKYLNLDDIKISELDATYKFISFSCYYNKFYKLVFGKKYSNYKNFIAYNTSSIFINKAEREREASFNSLLTGDKLRNNLYSEVLKAIVRIEKGIAKEMELIFREKDRKITCEELDEIVVNLESNSDFKPFIEEARTNMSWIKLPFNEALSKKLEAHHESVAETDLDKFVAAKNKSFKEKISEPETLAVFQRLKDR